VRSAAASALASFPGDDVTTGLRAALRDADRTVRLGALESLIGAYGLPSLTTSYLDAIGMWKVRLASPLAAVRADVNAEIEAALDGLARGRSAESLGLTYAAPESAGWVARLIDSFSDEGDDLALDALDETSGPDRTWAEHVLLSRLTEDPRAARALAHVGSTRAIPALREVAGGEGAIAAETARALATIAGVRPA